MAWCYVELETLNGQDPDDARWPHGADRGVSPAHRRGSSPHHRRDLRGTRSWRSQRERGVPCRQGAAEPQRGPHPGARVAARPGRDHRCQQAQRRHRQVRRDRHADRRGHRKEDDLPARRRRGSRRKRRSHLDLVADRTRHDRQGKGRFLRGHGTGRRALLRDPQGRVLGTNDRCSPAAPVRRAPPDGR